MGFWCKLSANKFLALMLCMQFWYLSTMTEISFLILDIWKKQ